MTRKWGPEELAWHVFNVTGILPVEPEPTLYGGRGIRYIGRVEQWPRREEGWRVYARGGFPTPKLGNLYRVSTGAGSYPYAIDLSALSDMEQLAYAARPLFRKSGDRRSPRRSWESYVESKKKKKKTRRNPADYEALFRASYGRSQRGVVWRDKRVKRGTQTPTAKAVREARARYGDFDHLIRNRQDYEETLGFARKGRFYRMTTEPTREGLGYFVWPMPPGERTPVRFPTPSAAKDAADYLSETADPRRTKKFWKPPARPYTKRELAHWLPPASAFRRK